MRARHAFSHAFCLCLLACTQPATEEPPPGAVRGELVAYTDTIDDGTSEEHYALRPLGEREVPLVFDAAPDLISGVSLDVWGTREGQALHVRRFEVVAQPLARALISGMPYAPRTFAFAIVHIGAPPANPLSVEAATEKLIGLTAANQPSVRQYYMEASYGRQDISGKVFGPFDFTMPMGCPTGDIATAIRPMIPGTFDHYLWYMEPRTAACSFSGRASGGSPNRPARDTWYNASSGCVVLMQEPGHNFGMRHSSAMRCGTVAFVDAPNGTCTHNEYGDRYDPMGGGCRHMNGYQKSYQGWLDKCNLVETGASGTFTIVPLELPCDGVQTLAIKMPKDRPFAHEGGGGAAATDVINHYYVELRAPIGIDRGLGPIVQVRVGGDVSGRNIRGLHTWFLDMDPASATTLDGLAVGATFADPTGFPKITVVSADNMKASVKVEYEGGGAGGAVCLDGTMLPGAGPGPESCAANPAAPAGSAPPPPLPTPRDGGAGGAGGSPMRDAGRDVAPSSPDAGGSAGGAGGTTGGTGGAGGTPVSTDAQPGAGTGTVGAGGCGCRIGATRPAPSALLLLLVLLRRRRPGRQRSGGG